MDAAVEAEAGSMGTSTKGRPAGPELAGTAVRKAGGGGEGAAKMMTGLEMLGARTASQETNVRGQNRGSNCLD